MQLSGIVKEDVDPELEDLLVECYIHTDMFCKTFMPKTFWKPFSKEHKRVFEALDDETIQKLVIAMPRGWGKTSIMNKAYPAKKIVFQDKHYVIPISSTGPSAKEFSENLKDELLNNENLIDIFGPIRADETGKGGDPFSTLEWVTDTGIKVMPRGAGQQIRGRIFKMYRPDLYLVDDIEDDEGVESEEQRYKLKKWFFSAVKNSVEFCDPTWRIVVIGTVLHEDSLLSNLLELPDWHSIRVEVCDDSGVSNWPEHQSDEQIVAQKEEYKKAGLLPVWYREFRNIPISIEDRGFKPNYFHSYDETEEELNANPNIESVVLADPAKTLKEGSADTAIVGVSINVITNKWYVRDVVYGKMSPGDTYDEMFAMAARINALVLAPEVTGLNEYITYPLRNEMLKKGLHYIIIEVKPRQGKTGPKRSGGLVPLYRGGHVLHNRTACGPLETDLLQWPRPRRWDIIDALAGFIFVLDEGEKFFSPPEGDIEDEYDKIDYEEPLIIDTII